MQLVWPESELKRSSILPCFGVKQMWVTITKRGGGGRNPNQAAWTPQQQLTQVVVVGEGWRGGGGVMRGALVIAIPRST